jgi:tetratricopeptide (TPR) repeat protein
MDLRYDGPAPAEVYAYVADDVGRGHAVLSVTGGMMQPGDVRHVSVNLTDDFLAANSRCYLNVYYDGSFRTREVAALQITVPDPPGPFTLYVDNIRLTPRAGAEPAETAVTPSRAAAAPELRAQATALLQEAVVLKRNGEFAEAVQKLQYALKLDDQNPEIHRVLGWTLAELNRKAEAVAEFRTVLELNPGPDVRAEVEAALRKLE